MTDTDPIEVAKAALCEAGHPELAELVRANKIGVPTIENDQVHETHRSVITRAFLLGHLAAGHDDRLTRGINSDFEWCDTIDCEVTR